MCQLLSIAPIGLYPITSLDRYQRGRYHLTLHAQLRQLPVHDVTCRSCLIAGSQLLRPAKLLDHLTDRFGAVGNRAQTPYLTIRLRNCYGDRLGMDIQTQKSYLLLHDRLPSACGSELCVLLNSQPNPRSAHRRRSLHTDCIHQVTATSPLSVRWQLNLANTICFTGGWIGAEPIQ